MFFQMLFFGSALSGGLIYLILNRDDMHLLFSAFAKLTPVNRFFISVVAVATTYFGGAMYIATPETERGSNSSVDLATPASSDSAVGFVVPSTISNNDKEFFDATFYK